MLKDFVEMDCFGLKITEDTERKIKDISSKYAGGTKNQLIEEMAELTKAFCKVNRFTNSQAIPPRCEVKEAFQNIDEETADVFIALMEYIWSSGSKEDFSEWIEKKVNKIYDLTFSK